MIKNYLRILVCGGSLLCNAAPPAMANFAISPSGATTLFAIDAANQGTALCAAASTECGATVPINAAGAPLFTSGAPGLVTLTGSNTIAAVTAITNALPAGTNVIGHAIIDTGSTTAATQATAANLNATVVGTGTFVTQSTLAAETTKVIGTTRTVGNIGGVLDAIGQNVAAPANWLQMGCQFQTSPTTITATNGSPCQMDNAGNVKVNVQTALGLAQGSTTSGQTGSMIMGAVTTANPSYTTAQTAYASLDIKGNTRTVLGGGIPETATATGTTGATTATLATSVSATTYICGFSIRANATAAATGNATVTGVITGTLNFTQWTAPNASGLGVLEEVFVPCIPASAVNTSIAVVSAAPGTGGVVSTTAWGYLQ